MILTFFAILRCGSYLKQNNKEVVNILQKHLYYINLGLVLGDSGYMLKPWLMTPFRVPKNEQEVRFNASHKKTRVIVEMTFGMWKRRFSILSSGIRVSLDFLFARPKPPFAFP
jgi:hypothetical protein